MRTLNYWLNGDVQFDYDWDPVVMTGADTTEDAVASAVIFTAEGTEGAEAYISRVDNHVKFATLQGFPD